MAEFAAKRDPKWCPTHPGELLGEVISATGKTKTEIAALLGISRQHLYDILKKRKPVSPAVAVRLGKLFGDGAGVCTNAERSRHLACRARPCGRDQENTDAEDGRGVNCSALTVRLGATVAELTLPGPGTNDLEWQEAGGRKWY